MRKTHLPCPCGKSSDAYAVYEDGGYCYSCSKRFWNNEESYTMIHESGDSIQRVPYRSHTMATLDKYNVKLCVLDDTGQIAKVYYDYPDGAVKVRAMPKTFSWLDFKGPSLYGMDKFAAGSALAITVTEGEEDAHSVYAMLGHKYPAVSVQSSSQAAKDCAAAKDYLNSFEKIYLCFDNDEPGRRAEAAVSTLFPFNKIYIVRKGKYKDANGYEEANDGDEYRKIWYNAKRHDPENIVSSFTDLEEVFRAPKKRSIASFPFKGLQDVTYGIRTGETYLFKALEGIGKTEVIGAIEYHVTKNTDLPIGIIHLEEDIQRSAIRLVGYEVGQPVHLEGFSDLTPQQQMEVYKELVKADNRVHFYIQGKNDQDVEAFLNSIRFMVAQAGCKIVFFDHISRVATSFALDVAGLDSFATRLSKLALELDFALIMITHVNDDGLTRGSRNISKEAWTVISLQRDKLSPDPIVRNTTKFIVEKNRHASITGPAGQVHFDPATFKLSDDLPAYLPEVK